MPGLPEIGSKSQLYGSELVPSHDWNTGNHTKGESNLEIHDERDAEAYVRGGNKYEEQAEELMQEEEASLQNDPVYQA